MKQNRKKTEVIKILTSLLLVLAVLAGGILAAVAAEDAEPGEAAATPTTGILRLSP